MSNVRYEFSTTTIRKDLKFLYFTKSEYGADWHSMQHFHPFLELMYVFEGKGTMIIDDRSYPIERGDYVVINPYTIHTEASSDNNPMKYYILAVDDFKIQLNKDVSKNTNPDSFASPIFRNLGNDDKTVRFFNDVTDEFEKKELYYDTVAYHKLACFFIPFLRANNLMLSSHEESKGASKELIAVKQYIDAHYAFDISIDDLAQKAFLNKYHLIHYFKQTYGVSPIRYLTQKRIQEAQSLLRTTDLSITAIANAVGFTSPSFFAKQFKELTLLTPKEYRAQCRQ